MPDLVRAIRDDFPDGDDRYELRTWWHRVLRDHGRFSCYATFLVLPSDKEALRYLRDYGRELDIISAKDCMVVAFSKTKFRRSGFDDEVWGEAINEHISGGLSVSMAQLFKVEFTDFPCFLFFRDIRAAEHILVTLKEMNAEDIAIKLRSVFSLINQTQHKGENPVEALSRQRNSQDFQKLGNTIISELRSLAGTTLESAMQAVINAAIK